MYRLIHPVNVQDNWTKLAPWIAIAIGEGEEIWKSNMEIIQNKAMHGAMQIWVGEEGEKITIVLVTEAMMLGGIPTLVMRYLSSPDFEPIFQDFSILEAWAIKHGFESIQVWGRKGWERIAKPLGFTHEFTVLNKALTRGIH